MLPAYPNLQRRHLLVLDQRVARGLADERAGVGVAAAKGAIDRHVDGFEHLALEVGAGGNVPRGGDDGFRVGGGGFVLVTVACAAESDEGEYGGHACEEQGKQQQSAPGPSG